MLYVHVPSNSLTSDPLYMKDKQFGAQFHPDHTLGHIYTINNK